MVQASPLRPESHLHVSTARCPACDQPVPNEKLEEITSRLHARESEIAGRLNREYEQRLADEQKKSDARLAQVANDNAKEIERIKTDAAQREATLRAEVKAETEATIKEQIAEALQKQQDAEIAAQKSGAALEELKKSTEESINKLKSDFIAREAAARSEAADQVRSELQQKLQESDKQVADIKSLLEERTTEVTGLQSQISELKLREIAAHNEGKAEAEAAARDAIAAALAAKNTAETECGTLRAEFQSRLDEQRAALEKDKADAVNGEKVKFFEEKVRLEGQLKDLARKLEQKTADELGEGAEVKLLEELKNRYPDDSFHHVGKGNAGADIIHEVHHNGKVCGKLIYDSKNRSAWRNDYVSKLRQDQVAAEADHAILSSLVLPAGTRQLHIQDGVIVANPARVLILVDILRDQVIRNYKLRLSNESKSEKRDALYNFITSELCGQLFKQIESRASDILDLDVKEQKAHKAVWEKRGQLARSIQKAHADLSVQIERVLGTAADASDSEE